MNSSFLQKIKTEYNDYDTKRRQVIKHANDALNLSKRAIFDFHRDHYKEGFDNLRQAEKIFSNLENLSKGTARLRQEGSWRAALEEYTEAKLFGNFLKNRKVEAIRGRQIDSEIFLGGLCDFTGELVRRAVKETTNKNFKEVAVIRKAIEEIMHFLIQLNLTGYLRTKYDQAKNNLRKIEEINYDISLKG